jgi:membrane protein
LLTAAILVAATALRPTRSPLPPRSPSRLRSSEIHDVHHLRALERGRGRRATTPLEIPWAGWRDILIRTYNEFNEDHLLSVAGGVVFFVLLAIFPTIAAFVSLYALFADPLSLRDQLEVAAGVMPGEAFDLLRGEVYRIASRSTGTLSAAALIGLAIALWSANAGTKALFEALNICYGETEKRSFIRLNLVAFAFTIGAIAFLLLAAAAVVVLPLVLGTFGLQDAGGQILTLARWPFLLVLSVAALSILYRYGPSRRDAKWRWLTIGSGAASILWLGGSALFSWYLANFADYSATYGSLGAAMGLLMWLWLTVIAVLLGAELDAEIEHQTAVDSTVGPPKPLGQRGATMADTVGPAQE